jgi:SAM-dependent methyltransferase
VFTTEPSTIAAIRSLFDRADYRAASIATLIGRTGGLRIERPEVPAVAAKLDRSRLLDALVALFLIEHDLEVRDPDPLAEHVALLTEAGLIELTGSVARSTMSIVPHDELLIASDRRDYHEEHDFVPGAQRPTDLLARLSMRPEVDRALDLGTGCGVQALLLSRHCASVVATDLSERALRYARFNSACNGATNIEFRHGSLLEPVAGERFDIVVSNPPYVISPESRFVFRDSGQRSDTMCRELIAALPTVMTDGGLATILVSWVQDPDSDRMTPLDWIDDSCAGVVLLGARQSPVEAATQWNQDLREQPEVFDARVRTWMDYFEAEQIRQIGYGAVLLRHGGPNWRQTLPLPGSIAGQASAHLLRLFRNGDLIHTYGPEVVAGRHLTVEPTTELAEVWSPGPTGLELRSAEFRITEGLPYAVELDDDGATLLAALATTGTIADTITAMGADPAVEGAVVDLVGRLLSLGFLSISQ